MISSAAKRVSDINGIDEAFKQIVQVSDEGITVLRQSFWMLL